MKKLSIIFLVLSIQAMWLFSQEGFIGKYNVVWNRPSTDASGQMPLGNGDIAAGVYDCLNS